MTKLLQDIYRVVALLATVFLVSACVTVGDYGDAPDGGPTGYPTPFTQTGNFPTLAASNGAVTRDVSQATLGPSASVENDANDPADPDGQPNLDPSNTDSDNGIVDFVLVLTSIPPPAAMTVNVTGPPGSSGDTYYINALIDLNLDGSWGGVTGPGLPEWVVKNFPVQVTAGVDTQVQLPPFFFGFGNRLPDGAWMRILLSREPINGGDWDGTSSFSAGEVEDHVISLPQFGEDKNKRVVLEMSCPNIVRFPRGVNVRRFRCRVDNIALRPTNGGFEYAMNGVGNNGPSVLVQPLPPLANISCIPLVAAIVPGGPFRCGTLPLRISINPPAPWVILSFLATKQDGRPLPSQWTYRLTAVDPPAVVKPTGVTVGFGDSTGDVRFEEVEVLLEARLEISEEQVVIVLRAKDPTIEEEIRVLVEPGESFGDLSYEELLEFGEGPIQLPEFP